MGSVDQILRDGAIEAWQMNYQFGSDYKTGWNRAEVNACSN